jgi:glycosyltransferase involved in cell wall biosynthesis
MKIAYVVTRADPIGGVQIHIKDLAAAAQAEGHEVTVMAGGTGPFIDMLRAQGTPTVVLRHLTVPIKPLEDLRALRELRAILSDMRPDLIALHSAKASVLGRLAARSLGIPTILTAHGWTFTPGFPRIPGMVYRNIERLVGPLTRKIIAVSEFDRRLALEAGIVGADRIVTVHNGIPDVPLQLRAEPARTPARLVMVARFSPQKDHQTLLQALASLQHLDWELDLIGDGPLIDAVKSLGASLKLGGRIRFLGQRMDVESLLAQAQISILATNWEGFPLSILESMRAGLPVIASAVGGIDEAVVDQETGYLVPRGDVIRLRERLEGLLTAPSLRTRMGFSARNRYEQQFTLDVSVKKTLAVYEEVAAKAGRTGLPSSLPAEKAS